MIGLTDYVQLKQHLYRMSLASVPLCAACGVEKESAFYFICICPTMSNIKIQKLGKPIMSGCEYEVLAFSILFLSN
jgi:hypothetical protein